MENIVVDISFNQVGGLCTLCFLDQVSSFKFMEKSSLILLSWYLSIFKPNIVIEENLCRLTSQVDSLISQNHLFKRSIILIKAWCYYESRILGAHHGLISTYALETLVLYIFHVFNNSFHGPLEVTLYFLVVLILNVASWLFFKNSMICLQVLYRFLEFFSNFDWDNFCLSLWGPVPISSLPNVTGNNLSFDVFGHCIG